MIDYVIAADKLMFRRLRMAPLSGKRSKGQRRILESQLHEEPTGLVMSHATALQQAVGVE